MAWTLRGSPQDLMEPFLYTFNNEGPETKSTGLCDNANKALLVILNKTCAQSFGAFNGGLISTKETEEQNRGSDEKH